MPVSRYGRVLRNPRARALLLLGFLTRVPTFGVDVLLTVHVVRTLHGSWSQAGLVTAAATLAIAVSGPWRGRLLDSLGLRRVVLPSIIATAGCWSIAPFVSYLPLLALAAIAGLFTVPTFTVIRQGLIAATHDEERRTALSLDSIIIEFAFMLGPVLAIGLSTWISTRWVIFSLEMVMACMACLLWFLDPPIRKAIDEEAATDVEISRRQWVTPRFLVVCLVALAGVLVLSGSDVSFVAAADAFHASGHLGYVLAVWGFASALGGVVYGMLPKAPPLFLLLLLLGAGTAPIAVAHGMVSLAAWAFVAGLFCAPTMTASLDALTRVVPEQTRGEAMGWHGSFMTFGGAMGGPIAGWFIDRLGWQAGFVSVGLTGACLAVAGWLTIRARRRRRGRVVAT